MKKDKFLVIVFLGILFLVLTFYPIKHFMLMRGMISLNMTDNWQFFKPIHENNAIDKFTNFFNREKVGIENRITNYFPFYIPLNIFYQNFNFKTNQLFYKENIPIKMNTNGEYIFYNVLDQFYYLETSKTREELDDLFLKQTNFFKGLYDKGLDIYIYIPTIYEFTKLKENNLNHYVEDFKSKVGNFASVCSMDIKSIEEYQNKFYKTDHHWNSVGALEGYYSVISMLKEEPIKDLKTYEIQDKKYYGSIARSAMNDSVSDYLSDIDVSLEYDVLINGEKADEHFKPRKMNLKDYKFYDYYVQYYNGQYGEITYDFHQDEKENLLIFGDSFAWQIDYLLAASFNKTYVINLNYDKYKNGSMDILKYVKENNISKILFLGESRAILFDEYDYGFARKVK